MQNKTAKEAAQFVGWPLKRAAGPPALPATVGPSRPTRFIHNPADITQPAMIPGTSFETARQLRNNPTSLLTRSVWPDIGAANREQHYDPYRLGGPSESSMRLDGKERSALDATMQAKHQLTPEDYHAALKGTGEPLPSRGGPIGEPSFGQGYIGAMKRNLGHIGL